MSEDQDTTVSPVPAPPTFSTVAYGWWSANLSDRTISAHRALSARLRRAEHFDALLEPAVHVLLKGIQKVATRPVSTERILDVACLLAEIRQADDRSLAKIIGGADPVVSRLRFEKLLRADNAELPMLMRRTLMLADRRCNVGWFASDLLNWGDRTKTKWCIDYFS